MEEALLHGTHNDDDDDDDGWVEGVDFSFIDGLYTKRPEGETIARGRGGRGREAGRLEAWMGREWREGGRGRELGSEGGSEEGGEGARE